MAEPEVQPQPQEPGDAPRDYEARDNDAFATLARIEQKLDLLLGFVRAREQQPAPRVSAPPAAPIDPRRKVFTPPADPSFYPHLAPKK